MKKKEVSDTLLRVKIDRSKWRTGFRLKGHGVGDLKPQNVHGFMCIMGQIAHQVGVPNEIITSAVSAKDTVVMMSDAWGRKEVFPERLTLEAQELNDDDHLEDEERERALIRLFQRYDIRLKFIGEYYN